MSLRIDDVLALPSQIGANTSTTGAITNLWTCPMKFTSDHNPIAWRYARNGIGDDNWERRLEEALDTTWQTQLKPNLDSASASSADITPAPTVSTTSSDQSNPTPAGTTHNANNTTHSTSTPGANTHHDHDTVPGISAPADMSNNTSIAAPGISAPADPKPNSTETAGELPTTAKPTAPEWLTSFMTLLSKGGTLLCKTRAQPRMNAARFETHNVQTLPFTLKQTFGNTTVPTATYATNQAHLTSPNTRRGIPTAEYAAPKGK